MGRKDSKASSGGDAVLVFCACPDLDTARQISDALLEARLAACVQILPGLESRYVWDGHKETSAEIQLQIKTRAGRFEELCALITGLHPYEVPEILQVPVTAGLGTYLEWLRDGMNA